MKIDRQRLADWITQIQQDTPDLSTEEFSDRLASLMESHPSSINPYGVSQPGRFSYSTVGYCVMTPLGEKYRIGRIEVSDGENESGYPVHEGAYWMPHNAARQFEEFIDSMETELPVLIQIGSSEWCQSECASALGFSSPEEMNRPEKISEFWKSKREQQGNSEN